MFHYVYRLEDKAGSFYFGIRSCCVAPSEDTGYRGSGVWPRQCAKNGLVLDKSILSVHDSRQEAAEAEARIINEHVGDTLLMNRYFGVQNHWIGPRETSFNPDVVYIDSTMLYSSFWASESIATRVVWMTMMLLADKDGDVACSVYGLAEKAKVSLNECEKAIERLKAPMPQSFCSFDESRLIVETDLGWRFVNHTNPFASKNNSNTP